MIKYTINNHIMTSNQVFKIIIENIVIPKLQRENNKLLKEVDDLRRFLDRAKYVIYKINHRGYELTCMNCMMYDVHYLLCRVCERSLCEMCKFRNYNFCDECLTLICEDCEDSPLCGCGRCINCCDCIK